MMLSPSPRADDDEAPAKARTDVARAEVRVELDDAAVARDNRASETLQERHREAGEATPPRALGPHRVREPAPLRAAPAPAC